MDEFLAAENRQLAKRQPVYRTFNHRYGRPRMLEAHPWQTPRTPKAGFGWEQQRWLKVWAAPSHQNANVQIAQILFCSACLTPIKIVLSHVRSIRVTYVSAKIQISLGGLHQAALFAFSHISSRENSRPPARQPRVRAKRHSDEPQK